MFTYNKAIFFILLGFAILCWHQIPYLNLWGDEASSLALAEKSIQHILSVSDVHAPTYYLVLKTMLWFTGSSYASEVYIRLIHAFAFSTGLYFGYRILKLIFSEDRLVFYTLCFAIVSPSMLFYANNIRMYAFLFCFFMWFSYRIFLFHKQTNPFNLRENWQILASGSLLASLDYIGFFYYAIGSSFIFLKTKNWRVLSLLALPPIIILIIYAPLLLPSIQLFFKWQSQGVDTSSLLTKIFNGTRPFIELTTISYKNILIPLIYLFFYAAFLLLGTVRFVQKEGSLEKWFFLSLTYLWIITACIGCSITRLFLISQFFMITLIIYAILKTPILKKFSFIIFVILIAFNLMIAFKPLPKFASSIPYRDIAMQTVKTATQLKINTILIANNSENVYSIERYVLQINPKLKIIKIKEDFNPDDVPRNSFLFISYMRENNRYVDAQRFANEMHKSVIKIASYVNLTQLPFNSIWNKNISSKANERFAYNVYKIIPGVPAKQ